MEKVQQCVSWQSLIWISEISNSTLLVFAMYIMPAPYRICLAEMLYQASKQSQRSIWNCSLEKGGEYKPLNLLINPTPQNWLHSSAHVKLCMSIHKQTVNPSMPYGSFMHYFKWNHLPQNMEVLPSDTSHIFGAICFDQAIKHLVQIRNATAGSTVLKVSFHSPKIIT